MSNEASGDRAPPAEKYNIHLFEAFYAPATFGIDDASFGARRATFSRGNSPTHRNTSGVPPSVAPLSLDSSHQQIVKYQFKNASENDFRRPAEKSDVDSCSMTWTVLLPACKWKLTSMLGSRLRQRKSLTPD